MSDCSVGNRYWPEGENTGDILSREEALFLLSTADSIGEGVQTISEIYASGKDQGLVITLSFAKEGVGITHIMVKEGFLRLAYNDVSHDGIPQYLESTIESLDDTEFPFQANDYRRLKKLANNQTIGR